jgi:hypothetical protein
MASETDRTSLWDIMKVPMTVIAAFGVIIITMLVMASLIWRTWEILF